MKPITTLFLLLTLSVSASLRAADAVVKPNIILIVADDLGYRDLSCFGSPAVRTPNIDKLAAGGTKLTHFYTAAAVCSPTRASILTGRYPEFDKPLGPPKGAAVRDGWTYRREFSHASIFVDLETQTAHIDWKP